MADGMFANRRAGAAWLAAGLATAVFTAWLSIGVNLKRACLLQDSPYLDLCPAAPRGEARVAALRARITSHPGDSAAYVQLALAERSAADTHALDAAARLAPTDPTVLMLQADRALQRQAWAEAVPPLVQLAEHRDVPAATKTLAQLVAGGQGALLFPYLTPGSHWLAKVLAQMPGSQGSSMALPLVARALGAHVLEPDAVGVYIRQLKAAGAWADAYGLWLALHDNQLPVLYNAGFDEPFVADGFDWEVTASGPPSRAGAMVERRGGDDRGAVLDVRFSGRAIALPMVSQALFIGEGRYRLRGEYMSRQLRSESGLAWTLRCAATKAEAGKSPALGDTNGAWKPFSFEIEIPAGCGLVALLQLETYYPVEAALGARGRVAFDAFSLEKVSP